MTSLWHKLHWEYLLNNRGNVLFTLAYLTIIFCFGLYRFIIYLEANIFLAVARACGQMINVSTACSMIFVCRNLITSLRRLGLAGYLPLDHYIYFHKLTGWMIAIFSIFHTLGHVGNMFLVSEATTIPYLTLLFSTNLGIGWFRGLACLTGWILCAIIAVMLVFSMNFIRRRGCFEVSFSFVYDFFSF